MLSRYRVYRRSHLLWRVMRQLLQSCLSSLGQVLPNLPDHATREVVSPNARIAERQQPQECPRLTGRLGL
jgi:hypothetical protein